jgi:hypothetical protein
MAAAPGRAGADASCDVASLALLASHAPDDLELLLAPGTATLPSAYPVASILLAHLDGEPTLQVAGERLRLGRAETALVWRQGLRPRVREAMAGEAAFVAALLSGASLGAALDAAQTLNFDPWLNTAVHGGLLLGARLAREQPTQGAIR